MDKMKLIAHLHFFFLACLLTACGTKGGQSSAASVGNADSVAYLVEDDRIICHINAEKPAADVAMAVGEWLDEALGGYYTGDARDMDALVNFYGNALADTLRARAAEVYDPATLMEFEAVMTKAYETDLFVTYTLSTFYGLGGAHPSTAEKGATFRKSDGRRLGWDIVRNYMRYQFNEVLKQKLMDYFGVDNDKDLEDMMFDMSVYNLDLPETPPYFLENGIAFIYQQYEIAAYAMGMPSDTIPYDQMAPLLTEWAKRLIP